MSHYRHQDQEAVRMMTVMISALLLLTAGKMQHGIEPEHELGFLFMLSMMMLFMCCIFVLLIIMFVHL